MDAKTKLAKIKSGDLTEQEELELLGEISS